MSKRDRKKEWTVIIVVALVLHAALFFSIRPEFFSAFKRTISETSERGDQQPFGADAIVTITIEIEETPDDSNEQNPVQIVREIASDQPSEAPQTRPRNSPASKGLPERSLDIEALTGRSPETLPQDAGPGGLTIPPRPTEITWPDTRNLQHCLGQQIDVRIEVDETGRVLKVETDPGEHPVDCIRAALESARQIVFEPGEVDGVRTRMWTLVRIDFRRKE